MPITYWRGTKEGERCRTRIKERTEGWGDGRGGEKHVSLSENGGASPKGGNIYPPGVLWLCLRALVLHIVAGIGRDFDLNVFWME